MKLTPITLATIAALGGLFAAATLSSVALRHVNDAPAASDSRTAPAADPDPAGSPESQAADDQPLFRPEDLVLLEMPDRAMWQQPDLIMDQLNIADGSRVADVGAGAGWFTIRLARRVGPNGLVYAQDLQHQMVTAIARRVRRGGEDLRNVRVVQGTEDSRNLPRKALDAVLVVDVYPEVEAGDRIEFLRSLADALRPKGRIGIVNYKPGAGGPGPLPARRVPRHLVEEDAGKAGLTVLNHVDLKYQYLVVIGLGGTGA